MRSREKALAVLLCAVGCDRADPPSGASATAIPTSTAPRGPSSAPSAMPVLVLDDQHLATKDGGIAYTIVAAPGLTIDAASYRFEPTPFGKEPTAVHLMHGADEYYRADWNGRTRLTLDAISLSPVRGKGPFAGFIAGEKYIVAVGAEGERSGDGAMKFAPMWIAHVDVH